MIVRTSLFVVVIALSACRSSSETQLVGRWEIPLGNVSVVFNFRRDHMLQIEGTENVPAIIAKGTWRLDGDKLYIHATLTEPSSNPPAPDMTWTVITITSGELKVKRLGIDFVDTYKRIK